MYARSSGIFRASFLVLSSLTLAIVIYSTVHAEQSAKDPGAKCGSAKFEHTDPKTKKKVNEVGKDKMKWKECIQNNCWKPIQGKSGCYDSEGAKCKEHCINKFTTKGEIYGQCCTQVVESGGKDIPLDDGKLATPDQKAADDWQKGTSSERVDETVTNAQTGRTAEFGTNEDGSPYAIVRDELGREIGRFEQVEVSDGEKIMMGEWKSSDTVGYQEYYEGPDAGVQIMDRIRGLLDGTYGPR